MQSEETECCGPADSLAALSKEIEHALLDLQGPLDALELVSETLDLRHGTAVGWLVRTASDSVGRLREHWERLHELTHQLNASAQQVPAETPVGKE
jgi:hypothetical protein